MRSSETQVFHAIWHRGGDAKTISSPFIVLEKRKLFGTSEKLRFSADLPSELGAECCCFGSSKRIGRRNGIAHSRAIIISSWTTMKKKTELRSSVRIHQTVHSKERT